MTTPRATAAAFCHRIDRSRRFLWFAVFAPLSVLYIATMRTNPFDMSADPTAVSPSAWQLAHHGTPVLPSSAWPGWNPWITDLGGGHAVANRPPGLLFLAAPAYRLFGNIPSFSPMPGSLTAALITAAAMATLALVLAGVLGHRTALVAALIAGTATTSWAVSGTQLFPQGPDQLSLALALWALAAGRYGRAGAAYAFALVIRPTLAIAAAANGIMAAWKQRRLRPMLLLGLTSGAGALAYWAYIAHLHAIDRSGALATHQAAVGLATHGYGTSFVDIRPGVWPDFAEKVAGALVSPGRGILVGSPFLIMLLPGLVRAWRVAPTWVRSSAVGALIYELVQLKCEVFTGGVYFWSYRYPLEPLTLCAPLFALCWTQWTSRRAGRRALFGGLVIVSVTWQALGALFFRGPYADRPWTFDNAHRALTHNHGIAATTLLVVGLLAAAGYVLATRKGASSPSVAQMLHVSGADRLGTVGTGDDDAPVVVDGGGPALERPAVTQRDAHVGAHRAADPPVGRGHAAGDRVAAGVVPAAEPDVETRQHAAEQGTAVERVGAARQLQ